MTDDKTKTWAIKYAMAEIEECDRILRKNGYTSDDATVSGRLLRALDDASMSLSYLKEELKKAKASPRRSQSLLEEQELRALRARVDQLEGALRGLLTVQVFVQPPSPHNEYEYWKAVKKVWASLDVEGES